MASCGGFWWPFGRYALLAIGDPGDAVWFSTSDIDRARARGFARFAPARPIIPMDCPTSTVVHADAGLALMSMPPIMRTAGKAGAFVGCLAPFSRRLLEPLRSSS